MNKKAKEGVGGARRGEEAALPGVPTVCCHPRPAAPARRGDAPGRPVQGALRANQQAPLQRVGRVPEPDSVRRSGDRGTAQRGDRVRSTSSDVACGGRDAAAGRVDDPREATLLRSQEEPQPVALAAARAAVEFQPLPVLELLEGVTGTESVAENHGRINTGIPIVDEPQRQGGPCRRPDQQKNPRRRKRPCALIDQAFSESPGSGPRLATLLSRIDQFRWGRTPARPGRAP